MKKRLLAASTALYVVAFAAAANAVVTGSTGQAPLPFISLSNQGLDGGSLATLTGGTVFLSSQAFAGNPEGAFGGTFLSVGGRSGQPATLTFSQNVTVLGLLIGSPDTSNLLTIMDNNDISYVFNAASLGFAATSDQNASQYLRFFASAGTRIRSVTFNDLGNNTFETANFATNAVPEPATWAMMILGFGAVGGTMRSAKRKDTATASHA